MEKHRKRQSHHGATPVGFTDPEPESFEESWSEPAVVTQDERIDIPGVKFEEVVEQSDDDDDQEEEEGAGDEEEDANEEEEEDANEEELETEDAEEDEECEEEDCEEEEDGDEATEDEGKSFDPSASLASLPPAAARADSWTDDTNKAIGIYLEKDKAKHSVSQELDSSQRKRSKNMIHMGVCQLYLVGIRYYKGKALLGHHVNLIREPDNPYDNNAIRVDNLFGEQVGYIKREEAAILAPLLDQPHFQKHLEADGKIPEAGDEYKMPLQVDLYWDNTTSKEAEMSKSDRDAISKVVELLKNRATFLAW